MADLAQLQTALRNADAAGDTEAARILAAEIGKAQSGRVTFGDVGNQALADIKAVPGKVWNAAKEIAQIPGRAAGAVQQYEQTGEYNPAPFMEAATLASPASAAMRAGERMIPGAGKALLHERAAIPSAEALKEAAEAGYKRAGDMGVDIAASAIKNFSGSVRGELEKDGVFDVLAPKTFAILKKLEAPPDGAVASLQNINTIRKTLRNAARDFANPTEQMAAKRAIDRLDEFTAAIPEKDIVAGPAAAAFKELEAARGNYAAAKRSDKITGAQERAELNAAVSNSGQNVGNATRQRIRDILVRPKEAAGYSSEELAKMEDVARGSLASNLTRGAGNLLGGGGGLGAMVSASIGAASGSALAGPFGAAGAAAPAVGYGLKKISNALTGRQVNQLDDLVRTRSPLFEQTPMNMTAISPEKRAAIIRLLALEQQQ